MEVENEIDENPYSFLTYEALQRQKLQEAVKRAKDGKPPEKYPIEMREEMFEAKKIVGSPDSEIELCRELHNLINIPHFKLKNIEDARWGMQHQPSMDIPRPSQKPSDCRGPLPVQQTGSATSTPHVRMPTPSITQGRAATMDILRPLQKPSDCRGPLPVQQTGSATSAPHVRMPTASITQGRAASMVIPRHPQMSSGFRGSLPVQQPGLGSSIPLARTPIAPIRFKLVNGRVACMVITRPPQKPSDCRGPLPKPQPSSGSSAPQAQIPTAAPIPYRIIQDRELPEQQTVSSAPHVRMPTASLIQDSTSSVDMPRPLQNPSACMDALPAQQTGSGSPIPYFEMPTSPIKQDSASSVDMPRPLQNLSDCMGPLPAQQTGSGSPTPYSEMPTSPIKQGKAASMGIKRASQNPSNSGGLLPTQLLVSGSSTPQRRPHRRPHRKQLLLGYRRVPAAGASMDMQSPSQKPFDCRSSLPAQYPGSDFSIPHARRPTVPNRLLHHLIQTQRRMEAIRKRKTREVWLAAFLNSPKPSQNPSNCGEELPAQLLESDCSTPQCKHERPQREQSPHHGVLFWEEAFLVRTKPSRNPSNCGEELPAQLLESDCSTPEYDCSTPEYDCSTAECKHGRPQREQSPHHDVPTQRRMETIRKRNTREVWLEAFLDNPKPSQNPSNCGEELPAQLLESDCSTPEYDCSTPECKHGRPQREQSPHHDVPILEDWQQRSNRAGMSTERWAGQ